MSIYIIFIIFFSILTAFLLKKIGEKSKNLKILEKDYYEINKKLDEEKIKNNEIIVKDQIIKNFQDNLEETKNELSKKKIEIENFYNLNLELNKKNSAYEQIIKNLNEQLIDLQNVSKQNLDQNFEKFENIANKILEEKVNSLSKNNLSNIGNLVNPLQEQIKEFKQKVDNYYIAENFEKAALKLEIKNLIELNKKVSDDANNLANALKSNVKLQGNWGEMQLKRILDSVGLQEEIHYKMQQSFLFDDQKHIPDCIIKMPDNKVFIIDSKVSLLSYEKYFNAINEEEKGKFLKEHVKSINNHIENLSSKNYTTKIEENFKTIDFVMAFIPIESALFLACQYDASIYEKALQKNVILVTNSTLIATLRTISYVWRQETIKKNYMEISKIGADIYNKFVNFTEDLLKVGANIDKTKQEYENAMNKLKTSSRKGDSLIGKAKKLEELGIKSAKKLSLEENEL